MITVLDWACNIVLSCLLANSIPITLSTTSAESSALKVRPVTLAVSLAGLRALATEQLVAIKPWLPRGALSRNNLPLSTTHLPTPIAW